MRTRFYIEKRKDATGRQLSEYRPVLMSVSFGGNRVLIGTGLRIDLNAWDTERQRVRTFYPGSQSHNNWLDTMQALAAKTMEALTHSDQEPGPDNFRQLFQLLKPKYSRGFFDLFYQFLESNSSRWSAATYRKIRSLYDLLREFEDQVQAPLTFQKMDARFLELFIAYCRDRGYKYSTIHRTVNNLVWFLNWSTEKGYNVFRDYRQFYKLLETSEAELPAPVFLSWDELMSLQDYVTENLRMDRVRDLFCFMSFTGVRFSELQRLKKDELIGSDLVVSKPGGGRRIIPMNKFALQIQQKYANKYYLNNTAFPSMSIITMNKYLRRIGRDLGLNRMVYAAATGEEGSPLYSRLTAGIAVNTFIRNAIQLEVPVEIIASFTGVQNDKRVRRIKTDLAAEEMKKFDTV